MVSDPRTPVIIGVGQAITRPDPTRTLNDRRGPIRLMADALRRAAEDCAGNEVGSIEGGNAPVGRAVLERANSLRVINILTWRAPNPGLFVAKELGISPKEQMLTSIGGNSPQSLMHETASGIARGELDLALVVGTECAYTRSSAQKQGITLKWPKQTEKTTPVPTVFGVDRPPASDLEASRHMTLPIYVYPLFENAIRANQGLSIAQHRAQIGALYSRFSKVASKNPYAWLREEKSAEEITTPTPQNRWVSFPYPKLCTANLQVDQAAAYICASQQVAEDLKIPKDRWIFPHGGAEANDHWFVSERPTLARSPAIGNAGARALELASAGIDEIGFIDLYSCFPCVVQIAAQELGLDLFDPSRELTLTGGLTFGGGPGNNYTTHGIAEVVTALRSQSTTLGLVSGLGWYATKHAIGIYGAKPPENGFRFDNVQDLVDQGPKCTVDPQAVGTIRIETYTVTFDRDGNPERAIVIGRKENGVRALGNIEGKEACSALVAEEGIGRTGTLSQDGIIHLFV